MKLVKLTSSVVLLFSATFGFNQPAFARQCIWNKAGFTLDITWIKDDTIYRRDLITSGTGSCSTSDDEYTVILAVKDGQVANNFTVGLVSAGVAALAAAGGVAAGVTTAVATAGAAGASSMSSTLLTMGIPNPVTEAFYVDKPPSGNFLDVWGTIWSPQTGQGSTIDEAGGQGAYWATSPKLWQWNR